MEEYTGSVFLDATYEGDLGAAAGVPFRVGREGKDESASPEPGASTNIGAVRKGTAARSRKTMPCSPTITASV